MIFGTNTSTFIKKQYILDTLNNIWKRKRTPKYSNTFLLDHILECNLNYHSWSKYSRTIIKYEHLPKYFAKYLNEIYIKWSKLNVFEIAYTNLLNDNYDYDYKLNNIKFNTDVTCISNMHGEELTGINPEYTKKNVTKLAILNTLDNTPISISIIDNKQTFDTYKTLCHDKTSIQPLLNNILLNINDNINISINGDKAYISNEQYLYKNNKVTMLTPVKTKSIKQSKKEIKKLQNNIKIYNLKINEYHYKYENNSKNLLNCMQKIKDTNNKINKLNNHIKLCKVNKENDNKVTKRYIIENYFCKIKHIPKLYLRTDKFINTFISTVYIGFLYNYQIKH